jgi:GNAT superfamily N-acetyltransferase
MSRRVAALTLDNLGDLPSRCRTCVAWELDPVAARRARETGDTAFEKEAWVSSTLLEWGSCGRLAYVDDDPAGFVLYAPPAMVPRSMAFPTSPVSADAVLLMTLRIAPEHRGGGLARMLVQAAAKDLTRRGVRAIEAFALATAPEVAQSAADHSALRSPSLRPRVKQNSPALLRQPDRNSLPYTQPPDATKSSARSETKCCCTSMTPWRITTLANIPSVRTASAC